MRGPDTPPHTRCTAIKSAFSASPEDRQPRHSVNLRFTVNFYSLFPSFLPHFFCPPFHHYPLPFTDRCKQNFAIQFEGGKTEDGKIGDIVSRVGENRPLVDNSHETISAAIN